MSTPVRTSLLRRAVLAAEVVAVLTSAHLTTRLFGSRHVMRLLGRPRAAGDPIPADPSAVAAADWQAARRVARAVDRVADALPWRIVCLPRALATRAMLRRRGVACHLHLGIASTAPLSAHAWVTTGGRVVQGGPVGHVTRLATLP